MMLESNVSNTLQHLTVGPISPQKQRVTGFPTVQRFLRDTPLYVNRTVSHVRILNKLLLEMYRYVYKALILNGFLSNKRPLKWRWTGVGALGFSMEPRN
jgi:hypothetical protein